MTDVTEQPTDYQKMIRVKASPVPLRGGAIVTVSGLTAWWSRATGSGDAGGPPRCDGPSPNAASSPTGWERARSSPSPRPGPGPRAGPARLNFISATMA
jgi:hypothetical protein